MKKCFHKQWESIIKLAHWVAGAISTLLPAQTAASFAHSVTCLFNLEKLVSPITLGDMSAVQQQLYSLYRTEEDEKKRVIENTKMNTLKFFAPHCDSCEPIPQNVATPP